MSDEQETALIEEARQYGSEFTPPIIGRLAGALEEAQRQRDRLRDVLGRCEGAIGNMRRTDSMPGDIASMRAELERQRDQARDIAVGLEQQCAEALRIAKYVGEDIYAEMSAERALREIVRVLSPEPESSAKASPDTEGETP